MSDYYSHQDRHRQNQTNDYYDSVGSGGTVWLWVGIFLFALVALLAAVFSGGGEGTAPEGAAPAAAIETPAPADAAPIVTE